jgi:hypothetical protein
MPRKVTLSLLLLFCLALPAFGQWNADPAINTPICTATGKQIDLRMESDGKGGAFVAWKDYRVTVPDIYIQRVNAAGVPLWTSNGVPLCTNTADQSTPAIVTDMQGGAIVAWSDWRSGIERDLYAQRVDSNGIPLWTTNGAIVTNKNEREHNEKITSDGMGGAFVVWEQQRLTDYTWDIWAQRISSSGTMLWVNGGIPVAVDNANRINPKIQADGLGGVFVVWEDYRNGADYDIYAQHLDASGTQSWGTAGKAICATAGTQINPKVDPDSISGGIYVAWTDTRLGGVGYDIYAARIDASGNPLWQANGVAACSAPNSQSAPDILSNRLTSGLILTWKDKRSGEYDIYAQKLDQTGSPLWGANGMPICNSPGPQINPNIATDKLGGAIVVWQDSTGHSWDVRSQRIDLNGNLVWTANGEWVSTAIDDQSSPKNISDGSGGAIYAWQDHRAGVFDIYVHHLYADGNPLVANTPVEPLSKFSAWPNPFSQEVRVLVDAAPAQVTAVRILDVTGRMLREIPLVALEASQAGGAALTLPAARYFSGSGIYLIQVEANGVLRTMKVVLI